MADQTPPNPVPPSTNLPAPPLQPVRKKRNWLFLGCGGLLAILLVIVATTAITIWWIQRPIKPVVLSAQEKAKVDEKLDRIKTKDNATSAQSSKKSTPLQSPSPEAGEQVRIILTNGGPQPYVPGSKVIKLSDREINGLLNANTDLGKTVRIEFARDAVNAYVVVPIPQDFPVCGGKMFRARGRFALSLGNGGQPYAILEDVTVFGLSLPKAWLGGIKGENLLGKATGERNGAPVLRGIKSLRLEPGALVLEVED